MMDKLQRYYVYFVSNKNRTTFYVGVTNSLSRRANEHAEGHGSGFTTKYNCHDLVYYERFRQIEEAIAREKQLKNWKREWKLDLIKSVNPELKTLEPE
jgi:putative endonuclease